MTFLFANWPAGWSREQRSTLAIIAGVIVLMLLMWLIAIPLAHAPEPVASNAEMFADGTRTTVRLTLVSGLAGTLARFVLYLGHSRHAAAGSDPVRFPGAPGADSGAAAR